jgi:hypothetical protein
MNVNLWGPPFWQIIHGISFLSATESTCSSLSCKSEMLTILKSLKVLLPCIHCRNSYNVFFDESEALTFLNLNNVSLYVYNIHNKVNEKLELQRLQKILDKHFNNNNELQKVLNKVFMEEGSKKFPDFKIIEKRWLLSDGKPFGDEILWRVLLILSVYIDIEDSDVTKKEKIANFIGFVKSICRILLNLKNNNLYSILGKQMQSLVRVIEILQTSPIVLFTSKFYFQLVLLAKSSSLLFMDGDYQLILKLIKDSVLKDLLHVENLWKLYTTNLLVGCSDTSCDIPLK